jgi:glyoxylase-like metal-dependent hydrolase (beta-lactamase superfamily II)/rhodanese-related sulfurtransferase
MNTKKLSKMTCEQIYNIWATEPEIISLLDLRSKHEFDSGHIPGSKHIAAEELVAVLNSIGEKLAVIIAAKEQELEISKACEKFDNFALLSDCHRWTELGHPHRGNDSINSSKNLSPLFSKGEILSQQIIFHQLFEPESSTYTYIIADKKSKEAAIIDPVLETVDRDMKLIEELGLKLIYALDTHIHADHITGAGELRKRLGIKTAVSSDAEVACVDIPLEDGQELLLGDKTIKVIATPGHTNTCLTYAFEGMIFTGDALLIRSCGRTDFQQGDSAKLYHSVKEKLFQLPEETMVYPGHDYRGLTSSTIGAEKKHNARLNERISLDEFKKIMSELKLANPKKIHDAVPANLACGQPKDGRTLHPQVVDGIPEISVEDLLSHMDAAKANKIKLIDVRRPDEYNNELGHIDGTKLITLGPDLTAFLEQGNRADEIVFVCRSGGRSGTATAESIRLGYKFTINMAGGMIRWNEKKQPVVRN